MDGRRSTSVSFSPPRGLAALALQMPGGAIVDAARSERRRRRAGDDRDQRERAGDRTVADLSGRSRRANPARRRQQRGEPGDCRDQPRARRSCRQSANASAATPASPRSAIGLAAAGMGAVGYFWSNQAVFLVTAALAIPTLIALAHIRSNEIDPIRAHGGLARGRTARNRGLRVLLTNRSLMTFAVVRRHLPARERGHAPADGEHRHHALEHLGDDIGGGLHRGAAARGRGDSHPRSGVGRSDLDDGRSCCSVSAHCRFAACCSWS